MNFKYYIAQRYFVSKKRQSAINIISGIALAGVSLGALALVVVLSFFNGMESLVKESFSAFDPELKIVASEGKRFSSSNQLLKEVANRDDVVAYAELIEETALFRYDDKQLVGTIMGVDSSYIKMCGLDEMILDGTFKLKDGSFNYTVIGSGVSYTLGASPNFIESLHFYLPKQGKSKQVTLSNAFLHGHLLLAGVFEGHAEYTASHILAPIDYLREVSERGDMITSVGLQIDSLADVDQEQSKIQDILGDEFHVLNRYEQHASLFKIFKSEGRIVFLLLCFLMVIISFNLLASISMLMIEKKRDINTLSSMGATLNDVSSIFFLDSLLITLFGTLLGITLGVLFCLGQQHFGWISMPAGFMSGAYPFEVRISNIIAIFIAVSSIGALASILPVKILLPRIFYSKENL